MASMSDWESVKEEIRSRVDFVSLVEEYVSLEQRGKSHWGLCPFHSEDTPSFAVTPDMGIYKCFGCGTGGDLFDFYMKVESCDFREALRRLGDRCGVELPQSDSSGPGRDLRGRIFDINEYAREKYAGALWDDPGEPAREYMLDRGFSESTLREFGVGYAPDGWRNMARALKRDGYDLEDACEAGLLGTSDSGRVYDRFRNRIVFPIQNLGGRVVGFGGRILPASEDGPKYLNSPESPVFTKRATLYGLRRSRDAVRERGSCLVMEGYTDVLRCHQAGFNTAVATLGTALTEQHAGVLERYAEEVILVYDGDEAGRRAARRGGRIVQKQGLTASVALLPEGVDPADRVSESPEAFQELIESRTPFLHALYDWLTEEYSDREASGKLNILEELTPLLRSLPSELERREAIRWLTDRLRVEEEFILKQLREQSDESDRTQLRESLRNQMGTTIEETFFRSLAHHPDQFEEVLEILTVNNFSSRASQALMRGLESIRDSERSFEARTWMEAVDDEYEDYLAGLLVDDEYAEFAEGTDPVNVARKIRDLDSSRRERNQLAREIGERDNSGGRDQFDEEKKNLLRRILDHKSQEQVSTRRNDGE